MRGEGSSVKDVRKNTVKNWPSAFVRIWPYLPSPPCGPPLWMNLRGWIICAWRGQEDVSGRSNWTVVMTSRVCVCAHQVMRSVEDALTLATSRQGQARAKYNFKGQTTMELSFRKVNVMANLWCSSRSNDSGCGSSNSSSSSRFGMCVWIAVL